MKKAVIRITALALMLFLVLGTACAIADDGEWTCPTCSQAGNTGNFCSNCGTAKPGESWECDNCGETGNTGNFCTNCGAARPDGNDALPDVQTVNEWLEQIPGQTDRVKVCLQGVEASGYIENKKNPDKWLPGNAADGDQSTCWQVKFKEKHKGKVWFQLNTGNEQTVEEIWFKNGFWGHNDKGKDQYYINARAKDIRISFLYSGESDFRDEMPLTLRDEVFTDWQSYPTGHREHVAAVRVTVYSKYKGSEKSCENDLCLSEVMLVQYAPAAGAKPAPEVKAETIYESNPAISGAGLLMKLATRTGPGTEYEENHTYFIDNWKTQTVKVLRKAWDKRNSIWWVQVEFTHKGTKYRLWTGKKRVDVDLDKVKESKKSGLLHVDATAAYAGPGTNYGKLGDVLFYEDEIDYYDRENGYVEIDYYDVNREVQRRVWVSEKATSDWH